MNNKSVCVLALTNVASDQRILKQIHTFCKMGLRVVVIGRGSRPSGFESNIEFHNLTSSSSHDKKGNLADSHLPRLVQVIQRIPRRLWLAGLLLLGRVHPHAYVAYYWSNNEAQHLRNLAATSNCDFFHANDIETLPAALAASSGKPTIFDAHEYAPYQLHVSLKGRLLRNPYKASLCWRYIPKVSRMTTVCDGIAKLYEQRTSIKPKVIRNTPYYQEMPHRPVNPSQIKMIHHGGASPERHLEDMIELVRLLPENYSLTFMLTSLINNDYIKELQELADTRAPGRVIFASPQPYRQLIQALNDFDIGVYILRGDRNINHKYALPNKLFEFIMAGLCVAIGPSIEMAKIVREYDCGVVADTHAPRSLAQTIAHMSPENIDKYKQYSLKAAKKLNAESEMNKLSEVYQGLLASNCDQ